MYFYRHFIAFNSTGESTIIQHPNNFVQTKCTYRYPVKKKITMATNEGKKGEIKFLIIIKLADRYNNNKNGDKNSCDK